MRAYILMIAVLGVISILYGSLNAMVQRDLKKLVAYSSVGHMGFVMLGIASLRPEGLNGAVLQMFNHGTITGMLFLLVGLIYERTHTRQIDELGGLFLSLPVIAGILAYTAFASLGLPSLSGFVGEFLILLGSFFTYRLLTALAALGIIITAGYMLWMVQRVCMGQAREYNNLSDATARELATLIPLVVIILIIGVYPAPLLNLMGPTVSKLAAQLTLIR